MKDNPSPNICQNNCLLGANFTNLPLLFKGEVRWGWFFTGQQRLAYLEKALQINPYNKQTLRLIERINPERAEEARMWIAVLSEIIDSV